MPPLRRRSRSRRPLRRLAACLAGLLALCAAALWVTTELPTPERLRARAALGDTRILDRSGRLIAAMPDPLGQSRRPVALAHIPLALRQATVAVEDAGFYQNPGVDVRGILRALWLNLASGEVVAGGSTITQQLARNFLLDPELGRQQSLERKLREATLALKLTASYSKDEILALYLNQTYYGGAAYGVEAAAWRLFGKPARELDLAEAALLAGLPQAPSAYDPLVDGGQAARRRQREVLDAMVRAGFLAQPQADAAAAEPLSFSDGACRSGGCDRAAPHFVAFVLDDLAARIGPDALTRGGLTITTTLDLGLQEAAQVALRRQLEALAAPRDGGPDHQARNGAVVVLDPSDGAILAMVGSPDFADARNQGQVNAATAPRQPGSALKPLTYAAALERGWTPASLVLDVPTSFPTREGRPYIPQNYDRVFHGPLSLREALATSSNVAAVRVLHAIGIPALLDMAERLGIHSLGRDPGRFGLALTLGGGEVTLLELSGAYAAFANGGQRVMPHAIVTVADAEGRTLSDDGRWTMDDKQPTPTGVIAVPASTTSHKPQALSPQVAYLVTDILADPYARMRAFGGALEIGRPAAVKTGTTSDWRDNWTVGYTPDRVVGVWVGNADGRPMEAVSGVSGAGPVWRAVMRAAHRGLPARAFQRPAGIVAAAVCADSGMLPGPRCPAERRELFVEGSVPDRQDDTHVALRVDPQIGCRAPSGYPPERTAVRVFRVMPPEAELWAIEAGVALPPRAFCALPDEAAGRSAPPAKAERPAAQGVPAIAWPAPGAAFALNPGVPRERQQIEISAHGAASAGQLTLLVDGRPLASFAGPPYRAFWQLAPGRHTIAVEVRDAQGRVIRGEPVEIVVEE